MFAQFRSHYPTGSLISELLQIHQGDYLVRASVQVGGVTLATGMAAAPTIELAEDRARERAIAVLGITPATPAPFSTLTPRTSNSQISAKGTAYPKDPPADLEAPEIGEIAPLENSSPASSDSYQSTPDAVNFNASEKTSVNYPSSVDVNNSNGILSTVYGNTEVTSETSASDSETWTVNRGDRLSETNISSSEKLDEGTSQIDGDLEEWPKLNASINVELEHLGWTEQNEQRYLSRIYSKKSRPLLSNDEAKEFLDYLQTYSQTQIELTRRLGWSDQQGREYLERTYSKKSRALLTCEQLKEFLAYLQSQPAPNENLF